MSTGPQNILYTVSQSSIHQRGVFAARDIRKGERIIEYIGEKITKAESERRSMAQMEGASKTGDGAVYIFTLNKRYDLDGNAEWNPARLINHSCAPNCEAEVIRGRIWILAYCDIKSGEELSFDYGFDLDSWQEHPCRCGKSACAGFIVAQEHWPELRKMVAERDACIAESREKEAP